MKTLILFITFFSFVIGSVAYAEETPHLQFVSEYIRELGAIEKIRATAESDFKEKDANIWVVSIHSCTSFQLELQSDVAILNAMQLNPPFDDLIKYATLFYKNKIDIYQNMIDISSAIIEGPKDGVDYKKMGAEMPKLRAKLEFIDKSLFEDSGFFFATLIDMKPDSQNHVSHLIVTKAEKEKLIHDIDIKFGNKLEQETQNYTVSAASVGKKILQDHKGSDDPW